MLSFNHTILRSTGTDCIIITQYLRVAYTDMLSAVNSIRYSMYSLWVMDAVCMSSL